MNDLLMFYLILAIIGVGIILLALPTLIERHRNKKE
jgi:hypothetical protein